VVLAVPVAPPGWDASIGTGADECIALATPEPFFAVGQFYADFSPTSDEQVVECLVEAARALEPSGGSTVAGSSVSQPDHDEEVEVVASGGVRLGGRVTVPDAARGVVVFAHGSGSSRHSPRNRFVASVLHRSGLGTLLFDLLTTSEEHERSNVFDVDLLARRLIDVTRWLRTRPDVAALPVGYFGASTGAAAALWAAAEPGNHVAAVVSRGGRPDLAMPRLPVVRAPTLLIVGGDDHVVLQLNREAAASLRCEHEVAVVPGATHLFEQPGTLDAAAGLARDWFLAHLEDGRGG
jgi:putative phosphoribosyl transferase